VSSRPTSRGGDALGRPQRAWTPKVVSRHKAGFILIPTAVLLPGTSRARTCGSFTADIGHRAARTSA
jgi:hypothetical protein